MPSQALLRQLLQRRDGRGHKLAACPVGLIDFCGSREIALFLWQLLYWLDGAERIAKPAADFYEAARLTPHNLRTAAAWLAAEGYGSTTATSTATGRANAYALNRGALEAGIRAFCVGGGGESLNDGGSKNFNDPTPADLGSGVVETLTTPEGGDSESFNGGVVKTLMISPTSSSVGGSIPSNVVELERDAGTDGGTLGAEQPPAEEGESEEGGSFNFELPPAPEQFPTAPAALFVWGAGLVSPYKSEAFRRVWLWRRVILWLFHETTYTGGMREQLAIKDALTEAGANDEPNAIRLIDYANRKGWKHIHKRKNDNEGAGKRGRGGKASARINRKIIPDTPDLGRI